MADTSFVEDQIEQMLSRLEAVTQDDGGGDSVGLLVSKIRALIATNKEIWERCQPSQVQTERFSSMTGLYRVGYRKVTVKSFAGSSSIQVRTASELEAKSFPALPEISTELASFFHIKSMPSSSQFSPFRIDYDDCLSSIICTKDEIARHFLILLKVHLEEVQVALGEMDRWLLQLREGIFFINETFNSNLSQPGLGNGSPDATIGLCVKCFLPYTRHQIKRVAVVGRGSSVLHALCEGTDFRQKGSFFDSQSQTLLHSCLGSLDDELKLTFDVSKEEDRERLKRFLHLYEEPEKPPPIRPVPPVTRKRRRSGRTR